MSSINPIIVLFCDRLESAIKDHKRNNDTASNKVMWYQLGCAVGAYNVLKPVLPNDHPIHDRINSLNEQVHKITL